tara:strand:- start:309 stop:740 length:432 start_codon:yes stop_codon:yes gene_type:complete
MGNYLKNAKHYCENNKLRFTPPRQQVLDVIYKSIKPISAYDILRIISYDREINPPTIYRAIAFWLKHNFIHRIESINSYIVCKENHKHIGVEVFVCQKCGFVDESHTCNSKILEELKKLTKHQIKSWNIEMKGLCQNCISLEN